MSKMIWRIRLERYRDLFFDGFFYGFGTAIGWGTVALAVWAVWPR